MSITTRKPTGKPSWPITLLAGAEKSGKTYAAAAASASSMIDRTFWFSLGEDDPDEYGAIDGARFEIVEHDGTYRGLLDTLRAATREPNDPDKPNLIVLDSASRLWELLGDMAQLEANQRAARKQRKVGDNGADISMDLWNIAAQRWAHVMDTLRSHQGPVIITARQEVVTVMDNSGQPTRDKDRKIKAHKSLPFDVAAIVEMRRFGEAYLTGVRSLKIRPDVEKSLGASFTVEQLWSWLGVAGASSARTHVSPSATGNQTYPESAGASPESPAPPAEPHGDANEDLATWWALLEAAETVEAVQQLWRNLAAAGVRDPELQAAVTAKGTELANAARADAEPEPEPVDDIPYAEEVG